MQKSSSESSLSIEWSLEEKIRLLELFVDKNSVLWEDRAKKLQEEFPKRPEDFFTTTSVKCQLNKIFTRPNPEHHIYGMPAHPRGKEAAEMWIKHFRKEIEGRRERREKMFAVALRKQLDLIRRHQQGKLPREELEALLLEARERDAKRPDKEEYEARINHNLKQLHTEDVKNVRTFSDYFRFLGGERIPSPVKSPSPVKIMEEPIPLAAEEPMEKAIRVAPKSSKNSEKLENTTRKLANAKTKTMGKNEGEKIGEKYQRKEKIEEENIQIYIALENPEIQESGIQASCLLSEFEFAELSTKEANFTKIRENFMLSKSEMPEKMAVLTFSMGNFESTGKTLKSTQEFSIGTKKSQVEQTASEALKPGGKRAILRTYTIPPTSSDERVTRKRKPTETEEFVPGKRPAKRRHVKELELDKPGPSTRQSPSSVSPMTVTSVSSLTSHDELQSPEKTAKKRRISRNEQTPKEVEPIETDTSTKRVTRRRTSIIESERIAHKPAEKIAKPKMAMMPAEHPDREERMAISDFSLDSFAEETPEIPFIAQEEEYETETIETEEVEGLFHVVMNELEAAGRADSIKLHTIGTQTRISVRHRILSGPMKMEEEEEIAQHHQAKPEDGVPARATRSSRAPHSLGVQTDKVRFARDDTFYVERESDGGWPGGYFIRTITIDEHPISSPIRSPPTSPKGQQRRLSSMAYSPLKRPLVTKVQSPTKAQKSATKIGSANDADTCAQIEWENEQQRKREEQQQQEEASRHAKEKETIAATPKKKLRTSKEVASSSTKTSPLTPSAKTVEEDEDFRIKVVLYPEGEEAPELSQQQQKLDEIVPKVEIPSAASSTSGSEPALPLLSEVAATTKLRSSLRRAAIASATPSPAVDSIGDNRLFLRPGKHSSTETIPKQILLTLWRDIHSHRFSYVFNAPVSEEEVPGYHSAIKRPMDMKTLKSQIESGAVHTFGQFSQALVQMFANAVMYNSTGHYVNDYAKQMLEYALKCTEVVQFPGGGQFPTASSSRHSNGGSSDSGRVSRNSATATAKNDTQKVMMGTNSTEQMESGLDEKEVKQQNQRRLFQRRPPRNKPHTLWQPKNELIEK